MKAMSKVTVKGQVLIPGEMRKRHHIEAGSQVKFFEYGELICIMPVVKEPVEAAWGTLPTGDSLASELLKERAKDFPDA
jgi:AbrB family looped-hinge helix DNA binding protein